ncbi:hypothetical protein WJX72_005337 [[Myrmecia] bisecta]|uniref:Uncharacterized protein n=1 Tax=[Myrmecia] bisecta TaxID=41462 RepID=A0AAW1QBL5_9CHLO
MIAAERRQTDAGVAAAVAGLDCAIELGFFGGAHAATVAAITLDELLDDSGRLGLRDSLVLLSEALQLLWVATTGESCEQCHPLLLADYVVALVKRWILKGIADPPGAMQLLMSIVQTCFNTGLFRKQLAPAFVEMLMAYLQKEKLMKINFAWGSIMPGCLTPNPDRTVKSLTPQAAALDVIILCERPCMASTAADIAERLAFLCKRVKDDGADELVAKCAWATKMRDVEAFAARARRKNVDVSLVTQRLESLTNQVRQTAGFRAAADADAAFAALMLEEEQAADQKAKQEAKAAAKRAKKQRLSLWCAAVWGKAEG